MSPPVRPPWPGRLVELPSGTTLHVRLDDSLGTDRSQVGDRFTATVTSAVTANDGSTEIEASR